MGILDDLDATEPVRGHRCSVAVAVEDNPKLADQILTACGRYDRSARTITDILARHGVTVRASSISRHRRGDCHCGK